MNRIVQCFSQLKSSQRKAFVAYVVSGDPRPSITLPMMHALVEEGVDVIELGIPFSDPMAEGPVIQLGHERALQHGVSLKSTLDLVQQFRATNITTPVVLMGYANPIERMGYHNFTQRAAEAGVDGVLTVDLPLEEITDLAVALKKFSMEVIYLIAPTTPEQRIREIVSVANGFIYYVSLKGVTGASHIDYGSIEHKVQSIKEATDTPLCVGFGIKDGSSAQRASKNAEGVVVGSAFVDKIGSFAAASDEQIITEVRRIAAEIRQGLDA